MGLDRPCPEHAAEHEQKREDTKGDLPWDLAAARCTRHALPLSISLRELHDQSPAARRRRGERSHVHLILATYAEQESLAAGDISGAGGEPARKREAHAGPAPRGRCAACRL